MQTGKSVKSVDELSPARVLIELTSAYWVSQAIYVVAKLGIAEPPEVWRRRLRRARAGYQHSRAVSRASHANSGECRSIH